MKESDVLIYLSANSNKLPIESIHMVRNTLLSVGDNKSGVLAFYRFKDPIVSIILSIFLGYLGIDRFYIGDVGLGILKLITFGGFGIWTLIDWFLIMDSTREKNLKSLLTIIKL